jgi:hypothetical protein
MDRSNPRGNGESLIREHTVQYTEGGPTSVSERSYVYDPPRLAKLAGTNPPKIGKGRDFSVDGKQREGEHSTSLPTDTFLGNSANRKANTTGLTTAQADAVKDLDLGIY